MNAFYLFIILILFKILVENFTTLTRLTFWLDMSDQILCTDYNGSLLITASLDVPCMGLEKISCVRVWLVGTSSRVGGGWGIVYGPDEVLVKDLVIYRVC